MKKQLFFFLAIFLLFFIQPVSAATGEVGVDVPVPCVDENDCQTGEMCCDEICTSVCSADSCTIYENLDETCNYPDTCDSFCSYTCDEALNYFTCSEETPYCPGTETEIDPPGDIFCCSEPCWECNSDDYDPYCTIKIGETDCPGQRTCLEDGVWEDCVLDDTNCGKVVPPTDDGGGGSGSGGGGGGGIPGCTEGRTKLCGNQIGACEGAVQTCINNRWTECSVEPTDEKCNTFDDDCEGIVDNIYGLLTVEETACWCVNAQNEPRQEECNGIDDDCNGIIDDYADCCFLPGETRDCGPDTDLGICEFGVSTCGNNELWEECIDAIYPERVDYCFNELDDDCNGLVDDNCEHCSDGIHNFDEVEVDCGGSCLNYCINWFLIFLIASPVITIILILLWKKRR